MKNKFKSEKLRFHIGDVRDLKRLQRAMENVDIVIHAAAMKRIEVCEDDPIEAVKTNVYGAINVIDAALNCGVEKVIALSSDKACSPCNLYGSTKLTSDKLFINANGYSNGKTKFAVVRYGNVAGSQGSVIPFFKKLIENGCDTLPVTHPEMTRFFITLDQACETVLHAIENIGEGGSTYIKKIPSFDILSLIHAFNKKWKVIGIRPGEKLHEQMITENDEICETEEYYEIISKWTKLNPKTIYKSGFNYYSNNNDRLTPAQLELFLKDGKI